MKDIVIIANFCASLDKPVNSRFTYLADHLYPDNSVELIASSFSHEIREQRKLDLSTIPYNVTLIYEPGYKKNISVQRFFSHRVWGNNVAKYLEKRKKPDVVYCAIPSLTVAVKVGEYCNKNSIKFVIDIQDLWPESFLMVFNVPVISSVAMYPFKRIVEKGYRYADDICAVSETFAKRAQKVNIRAKLHPVFLGTDLSKFDENVKMNQQVRNDKNEIWIGYCGSLSESYDIPCVIDALDILRRDDIKLVVIGDGHKREEFEAYAKKKLGRVEFVGRVPYSQMCGLLCACDITVNPIAKGSAASIINKHADYAASGLPVINTQESAEYRKLVEQYSMGFNCDNADQMAQYIALLADDIEKRKTMGSNARRCAEEKFNRSHSYKELYSVILD